MLTVAIASGDVASSAQLLAILQQTGLVKSVKQWSIPADKLPDSAEPLPDVVLLDLSRDPDPYFQFGAQLRRARPTIKLVACSAAIPPNHQLLLEAMRCGVQDFLAKPVEPAALKDILSRFMQDLDVKDHSAMDRLIVGDGREGWSRRYDGRRKSRRSALDLRAKARCAARFRPTARQRASAARSASQVRRARRGRQHGPAGQPFFRRAPDTAQDEAGNSGWRYTSRGMADHRGAAARARRERCSKLVRHGPARHWLAVFFRVGADSAHGPHDPDRGRSERARAVDHGASPAGHEGPGHRARPRARHHQSLAQRRRRSAQEHSERHQPPVFACLPNDFRMASAAVNLGTPMQENHNNILSSRYRQIAAQLAGLDIVPANKKSSLGGFFSFPTKR